MHIIRFPQASTKYPKSSRSLDEDKGRINTFSEKILNFFLNERLIKVPFKRASVNLGSNKIKSFKRADTFNLYLLPNQSANSTVRKPART